MTKPMIRIHNTETDEVIDREMSDAEFAEYTAEKAASDAAKAEAQSKEDAKTALLSKLGISAEEAALLLGGSN